MKSLLLQPEHSGYSPGRWALAGVALLLLCACPPRANWNVERARLEAYQLDEEVGLKNGQPEEKVQKSLQLDFDGAGHVTVTVDAEKRGPLPVSEGGHLTVQRDTVPAYEAVVLLSLLPEAGAVVHEGDTWETFFPKDADLASNGELLELQDRYRIQVKAIRKEAGGTFVDFEVSGDVRLADNAFLDGVKKQVSGGAAALLDKYRQFQPCVTGTAVFDTDRHRLQSADLHLVLMPLPGLAPSDLPTSPHRRHVVANVR